MRTLALSPQLITLLWEKLRTGNGWLLTEDELVCLKSKDEIPGVYPPLNLGEWKQWAYQYTNDQEITWAGLAETIRTRRAKEHQEYETAVNKIISKHKAAVDAAKRTAETELREPILRMRLQKTLGNDAARAAVKMLSGKGFKVTVPELNEELTAFPKA